jgi:hypothetical protein
MSRQPATAVRRVRLFMAAPLPDPEFRDPGTAEDQGSSMSDTSVVVATLRRSRPARPRRPPLGRGTAPELIDARIPVGISDGRVKRTCSSQQPLPAPAAGNATVDSAQGLDAHLVDGPAGPTVSSLARAARGLDADALADAVRTSIEEHGVVWTWQRLIHPVWNELSLDRRGPLVADVRHVEPSTDHVTADRPLRSRGDPCRTRVEHRRTLSACHAGQRRG